MGVNFQLEARDRAGRLHRERIEAADARQAHQMISSRDLFVIRLTPEVCAKFVAKNPVDPSKARRRDVPIRTEQLAQLLGAGMRLSEALDSMATRCTDRAWGAVFEGLKSSVIEGRSLSQSMAAHPSLFDGLYRSMVSAGEAGGHLVGMLERLARHLRQREAIRQRVVGALVYPCIVLAAGAMTVAFFMLVMLPRLSGMFKDMGQALPFSTQVLVWTSDTLMQYGWMIPLACGAGWMLFRKWMRTPQHRLSWDRRRLAWPLAGRLHSLEEFSRFAQTLSTLLQSGVTLVEALGVSEATLGNAALREVVREARAQVRDGRSLHESLKSRNLLSGMLLDMLAVGERTGDLGGALRHAAESCERDLDRALLTFTSLVEPILIVAMAAFVGSIVFSVVMAVFDLTSGIGRM